MMKRIFTLIFLVGVILSACNSGNKQANTDEKKECADKKECLTVDEFLANAADYVGKEVDIDGTVSHVCKHGGKRMFLFGENPEATAKVVTGEGIANFDVGLEGSDVCVHGVVEELRIDEAYLQNWEAELAAKGEETEAAEVAAEEEKDGHDHGDQTKHGDKADMGEHKADLEKIQMYRDKFAKDSIDHISYYTVVATKFEKIEKKVEANKEDHEGCEGEKAASKDDHEGCGEKEKTEEETEV